MKCVQRGIGAVKLLQSSVSDSVRPCISGLSVQLSLCL